MIRFRDNDTAIRASLDANVEYKSFVQPGNPKGYIFILVENGHVVLFHNTDDRFSSFLLPDELYYYRNNIDDIRRVAGAKNGMMLNIGGSATTNYVFIVGRA